MKERQKIDYKVVLCLGNVLRFEIRQSKVFEN